MFSSEICKLLRAPFFTEHLQWLLRYCNWREFHPLPPAPLINFLNNFWATWNDCLWLAFKFDKLWLLLKTYEDYFSIQCFPFIEQVSLWNKNSKISDLFRFAYDFITCLWKFQVRNSIKQEKKNANFWIRTTTGEVLQEYWVKSILGKVNKTGI